ncbi:hypothetical protein [Variovorax sp. YR216]|nr:hypothetical protein [Variovorax sp. YR216]SEA55359.1 hypothetical protein SAMN05444680_102877 [Variovorax sp. YR216]
MKLTAPPSSRPARGATSFLWTVAATLALLGAAVVWLVFDALIALVTRD